MKLSIIVIEYHSLEDIACFIAHLQGQLAAADYELIVSSNSCYDIPTQKEIQEKMPAVRWVFNERNGGFAYGMNRGLEKACGDYLMIANPDMMLKSGLSEAISFLEANPGVGALGPLIKNKEGVVQDSARDFMTVGSFFKRNSKRLLRKMGTPDYSSVQTVDWVIGACILMSRTAYRLTGGLDEHYFLYVEDMDLCTSIRKAGLKIVHYTPMEVEYEGTRSSLHSWKYTRIHLQSLWYYWKKFGFTRRIS